VEILALPPPPSPRHALPAPRTPVVAEGVIRQWVSHLPLIGASGLPSIASC
jgi:hypothetical protein